MTTLAPEVRAQFARRLKQIRTERGFPRARYFAKTLGIEENRYTRYERAEVEPSLTLIHKMCETLRVSPNELLGFGGPHDPAIGPGFAEAAEDPGRSEAVSRQRSLDSLAWRLAAEVVAIRLQAPGKSKSNRDSLQSIRETGRLFQSLQVDPFGTVTEIVADERLKTIDEGRKSTLAGLVEAFTLRTTQSDDAETG